MPPVFKVEIIWDPPKGEFTKYTLYIEKLDPSDRHHGGTTGSLSRDPSFLRLTSILSTQVT